MKKTYIIYIYDIKIKLVKNDKKNYNTIKRRFYMNLEKISKKAIIFRPNTKSMIITQKENEWIMDLFFKKFRKWVTAYKIVTKEIYELT